MSIYYFGSIIKNAVSSFSVPKKIWLMEYAQYRHYPELKMVSVCRQSPTLKCFYRGWAILIIW